MLQLCEDLGVAEEPRHVDQEIVDERVDLARVLAQPLEVSGRRVRPGGRHAPRDAATQGGLLVPAEVVPGPLVEDVARDLHDVRRVGPRGEGPEVRHQPGGHLLDPQHVVHGLGRDGAPRHAVEPGGLGGLHHGHPAVLVDGRDALRPVVPGAGEDDPDCASAPVLRERGEEAVDGHAERLGGLREVQPAAGEGERLVGRDEVDVVRRDLHAVLDLRDGHAGVLGEQLREDALVVGRHVLHQDERRAAVRRHEVEEPLVHVEPARRRPDADDGREAPRACACVAPSPFLRSTMKSAFPEGSHPRAALAA